MAPRQNIIFIPAFAIAKLGFIVILALTQAAQACASPPRDNCLRIEYGDRVRDKDGATAQELEIRYGALSGKEPDARSLRNLRAFYSSDGEGGGPGARYYGIPAEESERGYRAKIRLSDGVNRVTVRAQAETDECGITYRYSAKTSFVLFGRNSPVKGGSESVPPDEIDRRLEISLTPEFHYWPETGNPVTVASTFDKGPRPNSVIRLFDEDGASGALRADETGSCRYIPPEDARLNRKGSAAFKQVVMVAREGTGATEYISSYTLILHRSRFKNYRLFPGAVIFFGTALGVLLTVISARKRFDREYR